MAEFGDVVSEFKNAKPPEKILIIGAGVAILAIAVYIHTKSGGGGGSSSPAGGSTSGTSSGGGGGIQTVPGPGGSNVPILPSGLTPIFDGMGNLIGYEPTPTPTGSGSGSGTKPTPTPAPKPTGGGSTGKPAPKPAPRPAPKPLPHQPTVLTKTAAQSTQKKAAPKPAPRPVPVAYAKRAPAQKSFEEGGTQHVAGHGFARP